MFATKENTMFATEELKKHFERSDFIVELISQLNNDMELNQFLIHALSGATVNYMNMDAFKENVLDRFRNNFWRQCRRDMPAKLKEITAQFHSMPVRTKDAVDFFSNEYYPVFAGELAGRIFVLTANYKNRTFSVISLDASTGKIDSKQDGMDLLQKATEWLILCTQVTPAKSS